MLLVNLVTSSLRAESEQVDSSVVLSSIERVSASVDAVGSGGLAVDEGRSVSVQTRRIDSEETRAISTAYKLIP